MNIITKNANAIVAGISVGVVNYATMAGHHDLTPIGISLAVTAAVVWLVPNSKS